jgi:predicted MPP superfamily phosphohydrolase
MGHYRVGSMQLYVSRGLGGAPLRLLCRPEVTIITLRRGLAR